MLEGMTDLNDLFNLFDIHVAMVNVILYSGDGCKEGLVGCDVVREGNGMSGPAKWCW